MQTALAWFSAINAKNGPAVRAHFVRHSMWTSWSNADVARMSTFSNLLCQLVDQTGIDATVHCSFHESTSSMEGNPDAFWNIEMTRNPAGVWLIHNYGQG